MYPRLNNQSLAPAQADTWLLYTLAQIMASLLWPVPIVGSTDKGSSSRSLPQKIEAAKGGPIGQQPDLLLWMCDEGDPYLQTLSMCTQIQVRAYGEQKKAKMISARAHAYCVCLAACTPNKGAKLLQKPQQLSPRGELGVVASSDDITHPQMDRPIEQFCSSLCDADCCWRPVSRFLQSYNAEFSRGLCRAL